MTIMLLPVSLITSVVPAPANAGDGRTVTRAELPDGAVLVSYFAEDALGKSLRIRPRVGTTPSGKRFVIFDAGTLAVTCWAYAAPVPVYSPNHTLHYGSNAKCEGEPVQVRIRNGLFSGPDADNINTWQRSDPFVYGSQIVWGGGVAACVDWSATAWWEMMVYAEVQRPWGWTPFVPYPAKLYSQTGCRDIV